VLRSELACMAWQIKFDNIYDYTSNPHKLTS
jgi:hypothetical protein